MEWRSSNLEFSASVWLLLVVVLACVSLEVRLRANFAADVVLLILLPLHGFVTQRRCASTRPDAAQSACVLSSIQHRVSALTSSDAVDVKMTMTRCVVTSLTRSDSLRRTWEDQQDDLRGQTCERYNMFQARLERKGEKEIFSLSHGIVGARRLARSIILSHSLLPADVSITGSVVTVGLLASNCRQESVRDEFLVFLASISSFRLSHD